MPRVDRIRAVRSAHITGVPHNVARHERERRNGYLGGVMWFTGLSASGKSTLAMRMERCLFEKGIQA